MGPAALLALTWLPRVDAGAEVAYDLGLDDDLRATITLSLEVDAVAGKDWTLGLFTDMRTWVRENDPKRESAFRISPQQIHYPVGARLRFDLGDGLAWGLLAFHQSNHDVDSNDAVLNRETLAYEVYGGELLTPDVHLWGGMYYDRGTTITGKQQNLPFDYYLCGLNAEGEWGLWGSTYAAARLSVVGHRNADHAPAYVNLDGRADIGARFDGAAGVARFFLRFARVEDYQHQGDDPRHLLLLGVGLASR